jgi:AcrR family transcriptional regulator
MEKSKNTGAGRPKARGDAARNTRRILDAAREALRENPQASAVEIARVAGIGVATVYRRFPTREDLLRGVVWDLFATDLAPALVKAVNEPDPREGVRVAFDAALRAAARAGVTHPAGMTLDIIQSSFVEPVSRIMREGQRQGIFRADLDPEKDTLRIILMLLSVVPTLDSESEGWQRYLRLVMESLQLTSAGPLPPAKAVVDPFRHQR